MKKILVPAAAVLAALALTAAFRSGPEAVACCRDRSMS